MNFECNPLKQGVSVKEFVESVTFDFRKLVVVAHIIRDIAAQHANARRGVGGRYGTGNYHRVRDR